MYMIKNKRSYIMAVTWSKLGTKHILENTTPYHVEVTELEECCEVQLFYQSQPIPRLEGQVDLKDIPQYFRYLQKLIENMCGAYMTGTSHKSIIVMVESAFQINFLSF